MVYDSFKDKTISMLTKCVQMLTKCVEMLTKCVSQKTIFGHNSLKVQAEKFPQDLEPLHKAVMWIRIRIHLGPWIRIRIHLGPWIRIQIHLGPWIRIQIHLGPWIRIPNPDPDTEEYNH